MAECVFRKYKKEILCLNDLTKIAKIIERTNVGDFIDGDQNITNEIIVKQVWCAIDTDSVRNTNSYKRTNDLNIGKEATHRISMRYDDVYGFSFDVSKHSIEIDSSRYRIIALENKNEQNKIVDLYCIIRGDVGANEAQS